MSDLLDPATLTPESLYRLQSDTWAQGAEYERERILKILQPFAEHGELCESGCYPEDCDAASFQYAIELIKGEQK